MSEARNDGSPKPDFGEESVGANLTVVAGGNTEDSEQCANSEIRKQVLDLLGKSEDVTWSLAVVMENVYENDLYREWGFSSFRDYIEDELGIQLRKAQYLVQLQKWFHKMPGNVQKWIRSLGWTKARMLMHAVTPENAAEWKNKVAGKSVSEISKMLKDAKDGDIGGGEEGGEDQGEEKSRRWSCSMFPLQYQNLEKAMEKAMESSGSDKAGHNLDLICTDFLATNVGVDSPNEYLAKIERQIGLRLIAYRDESDEFVYGFNLIEHLESVAKNAAPEESEQENS